MGGTSPSPPWAAPAEGGGPAPAAAGPSGPAPQASEGPESEEKHKDEVLEGDASDGEDLEHEEDESGEEEEEEEAGPQRSGRARKSPLRVADYDVTVRGRKLKRTLSHAQPAIAAVTSLPRRAASRAPPRQVPLAHPLGPFPQGTAPTATQISQARGALEAAQVEASIQAAGVARLE